MKRIVRRYRRGEIQALLIVLYFLCSTALGVAGGQENAAGKDSRHLGVRIRPGTPIYANPEAERLAEEARSFDPMYCPQERRDRDRAAQLYEQAINAQPGASVNAMLSNRIAQLYATYEDKEKQVAPIHTIAKIWWERCLESTNRNQLLWSQAQMGLASLGAIGQNHQASLDSYDKILSISPGEIDLDNWKSWPEAGSDRSDRVLARERKDVQKRFIVLQQQATEVRGYVKTRAKERNQIAERKPPAEAKVSPWTLLKILNVVVVLALIAACVVKRKRNRTNQAC